MIIISLIWSTK